MPANLHGKRDGIDPSVARARLPKLAHLLATDLKAALKNDPAASGYEEMLLSYPGVEAITVQRLAHELYLLEVPYLAAHDDGNCATAERALIFIPARPSTNHFSSIMERVW